MQDIPKEVLIKASEGDLESFEVIYKAAAGFVYNVALRTAYNRQDAEEVTQEVFLNVYRNLKKFRFQSSFKTWLYRITVNMAINHYRNSAKKEKNRVDYDSIIESFPGGGSTAESAMQNDNEARLSALLGALNPEHKTCLVLREIEGLSYIEIADALKIPVNTVRSRLKRARQALLEEAGKEP